MKSLYILLFVVVVSCRSIQYQQTTAVSLPELGTLGLYTSYLLGNDYRPKTIANLSDPVRLIWEAIKIRKREIFSKKDSLNASAKDSTLISFEILDQIGLLKQMNTDKDLMKYLRKNERYKLVSQVTVHFPNNILQEIQSSDEVYLIQSKTKTLSLSLLKNNKVFNQIEFTDGEIVKFKTAEFCWGLNKRRELEIFDLVPDGTECSGDTFKSAKKVEKKNEFKF